MPERGVPAMPPKALPAPPGGGRQSTDLAPCPGINTDIRRPAGSNCLGILPRQCAADTVADIVGKADSPALRADVTRRTGNTNVRWIGDGEPVIENLDPTRLNIQLDAQRRVHIVDCY
jgi:Peptidase inhibitor I78 family